MIKMIIFDLDGVLIDSKHWHYNSLNRALSDIDSKYVIQYQEHLSKYDGLSTRKKLEMLSKEKGLDNLHFDTIWKNKQTYTLDIIRDLSSDQKLIDMFAHLRYMGMTICVASNSIRETVKLCLLKLGIIEYVDLYVSNNDVKNHKPFPEMYWKCMEDFSILPSETIIIEDSPIGRKGALASAAHLLEVDNPYSLTLDKILQKISSLNTQISQH